MPVVGHRDVNALARCDCGEREFLIGLEVVEHFSNSIKVIECVACGKQQSVPWRGATGPNQ